MTEQDYDAPPERAAWKEPAPKRRRHRIDMYDLRSTVQALARVALMGIGGYALLMAGMWLQAHQ